MPGAGGSQKKETKSENKMNDQTREGDAANPELAAADAKAAVQVSQAAQGDFVRKIVEKIKASENILIALSRNPSVDEIAAAIGLSLFLDEMQKHTTAIYSGSTPDALAFLQPDATFETNTASLQDFVIALSKEKADHLRYKLEGDFVKVFITPYKTSITEDDLSFSQGDYNVDFVIALNVHSAGDLDAALAEHGRIMHDAATVDITTGEPGRFGEIEWSNPIASSVCEMVTELIFAIQGNSDNLDSEVATALLTGIVAATDRFSNNRTNPDTLTLASKLMTLGANQQLITANVVGNEIVQNQADGPTAAEIAAGVAADAGAFMDTPVVATAMGGVGVESNTFGGGVASVAPASAGVSGGGVASAGNGVAPAGGLNLAEIPGARGDGLTAAEIAARAGITDPTPAMPVDASGTVVAPVLPQVATNEAAVPAGPTIGAARGSTTNEGRTDPSVMVLPGMNAPKEMATTEPTQAVAPQVGVKMEPPAPSEAPAVDYGQMMAQALDNPEDAPKMKPVLPPLVENDGAAPAEAPASTSAPAEGQFAVPGVADGAAGNPAAAGAPAEMPGEPVTNPFNMTLPPPPVPEVGADMMPPAMPPSAGATAGTASGPDAVPETATPAQ